MRVPINLAGEPFRKDRALIVASTVVGVIMTASLAMLIVIAMSERGQVRETREEIARLEQQLSAVSAQQDKVEAVLRRPDNAAVLDRSVFINELLRRKGISWTRLFSDLEQVMPHNVRLVSIRPQVNPRNEVLLDMMVGAQSSEPVIELLRRLEQSPVFGSTEVQSWLPPTQSEPLFRYRVSVNYAQKL
jgi:type IV pilus assembly protein PilN